MIEVQKFDKSFVVINPNMIMTMESDKTKEVVDENGVTYTVNDFAKGTKITVKLVTGETIELSQLGAQILRQRLPRADFNPEFYKNSIRMLRK